MAKEEYRCYRKYTLNLFTRCSGADNSGASSIHYYISIITYVLLVAVNTNTDSTVIVYAIGVTKMKIKERNILFFILFFCSFVFTCTIQ